MNVTQLAIGIPLTLALVGCTTVKHERSSGKYVEARLSGLGRVERTSNRGHDLTALGQSASIFLWHQLTFSPGILAFTYVGSITPKQSMQSCMNDELRDLENETFSTIRFEKRVLMTDQIERVMSQAGSLGSLGRAARQQGDEARRTRMFAKRLAWRSTPRTGQLTAGGTPLGLTLCE